MIFLMILALGCPQSQETDARSLIDQLNSDAVEERRAAEQKLTALGEAARAPLEAAARAGKGESVQRARQILRLLDLRRTLGPHLLKELPGIDRTLLDGEDPAWTAAFLEATEQKNAWRKHPSLGRDDLEPLAARAIRGASAAQWRPVLDRIAAWDLRSAVPELIKRLPETEQQPLFPLADALAELEAPEAGDLAARLLQSETDNQKKLNLHRIVASSASRKSVPLLIKLGRSDRFPMDGLLLQSLGDMDAEEFIPDLVALLDLDEPLLGGGLGRTLARLNARKAIPLLKERIDRSTGSTRMAAAFTMCEMNCASVLPEIRALLKDGNRNVRIHALSAVAHLGGKAVVPDLRPFLKESDLGMRHTATRSLAVMGDPEALPPLRELIKDRQLANDLVG